MTIAGLREYVNTILMVNQRSGTVSYDQFNVIIEVVNNELFDEKLRIVTETVKGIPPAVAQEIILSSPMGWYYQSQSLNLESEGLVVLPTNFARPWVAYMKINNRPIDFYSPARFALAKTSIFGFDPSIAYAGLLTKQYLEILSDQDPGKEKVVLMYSRRPITPVYDQVTDMDGNDHFLPEGSVLKQTGTSPELFSVYKDKATMDAGGAELYTNVQYIYSGVYNNYLLAKTKELDWPVGEHQGFANRVLLKLAIGERDNIPAQFAEIEKKEGK